MVIPVPLVDVPVQEMISLEDEDLGDGFTNCFNADAGWFQTRFLTLLQIVSPTTKQTFTGVVSRMVTSMCTSLLSSDGGGQL